MRLGIAFASLVVLAASACKPEIAEPTPLDRAPNAALASAATGATATDATPASSGAAAPAGKCIRPTPAEPTRTVSGPVPDPRCPKDDLASPPKLRTGKVVFTEAQNLPVTVEITTDEASRERGLMFRKSMPEDHGMIFAFDEPSNHQFWMHNTCIPLDMLFVDKDGTIVGIEENAHTMDDSVYEVGCPSSYVVEVNAGFTRKHGIRAGQKVRLEGI